MKLSYTNILDQHLRNIGKSGSTDATIIADFQYSLGQRYQLALATLQSYVNQSPQTASTVAGQQFYSYPVGIVSVAGITVTIGSVQYVLDPVYGQRQWDLLNALQIQPTAIPQFFFAREYDFGIWPIPQASDYTITFNGFNRDRDLTVADYTTGTIAVSAGSTTLTGTSTTFTPSMVGRWFTVTDTSNTGQGYWYQVVTYVSPAVLILGTNYAGSTGSGLTYRIGQAPNIPDEGHSIFADGTAADYYAGLRNAPESATWFENKYWTGSGSDNRRDLGNDKILSGLIGVANRYASRDNRRIIRRLPSPYLPQYSIWAQTLSGS